MRSIVFVRSARALSHGQDLYRPLSSEGLYSAALCRRRLGYEEFDMAIASPALRAQQTAALVSGIARSEVRQVDRLYPSPQSDHGWSIYEPISHIGMASLETYFQKRHAAAIAEYGNDTWNILRSLLAKSEAAVIAGHAVPLLAIVHEACARSTSFKSLVAHTMLQSMEGFRITFRDWKPTNLTTV